MGDSEEPAGLARIGLIGDVHTEDAALDRALQHLSRLSVDHVVCTGDLPDGHGNATAVEHCCELLREADVTLVSGNHDRWLLDEEMRDLPDATDPHDLDQADRDFLASLPATVDLPTVAGPLLLCHGIGGDDMAVVRPDDRGYAVASNAALQAMLSPRRHRFVVHGHSHRPVVLTIEGLTLINAGTLHRDHGPCFAVADFREGFVQFYDMEGGETERFEL